MKMLEKRCWSNTLYVTLFLLVILTIWHISSVPEELPNIAAYNLYTSNSSGYTYPINTLPLDDYHQLIDLHNFTFTIINTPCNDSTPLLLVMVHSHPKNVIKRRIVRKTWGRNTNKIKVLFVVGLINNRTMEDNLEKENEEHGDLVQGSFMDAYRNMTYKHVMVLKYAIYYCPKAKYILKTDDDVFVNMPLMRNFLNMDLSPYGGTRMLFCSLAHKSPAIRSWRSKWRVSFKEYSAKIYPPYCPGWVILYSPDAVFELYREAQLADYFWIDDVHITGTLAEKIHLQHVNINNLVLTTHAVKVILDEPQRFFNKSFLFGSPNIKDGDILALWEYVLSHKAPTSIIREIALT